MNRESVVDWQELSALYEQADALEPAGLEQLLADLRCRAHRLLPQLEQMLEARRRVATQGFLDALPRLEPVALPKENSERLRGDRVGAYRLVKAIGAGGMAEVWLAERADGAFTRQVALKLLFRNAAGPQLRALGRRFELERDILASLRHPHIAALHDAGVDDGQPWIALEFVEGIPITAWCDAKRLTIEQRVRVLQQVLLAVQHAHANLVIHRDLKPANILVTPEGQVRLLDFGIAKLLEGSGGIDESELTREIGRPLTLPYASPEQIRGATLTTACDVYSLGVVLYEVLCGCRPYDLEVTSAAQLEQAILSIDPRPPSRRGMTERLAELRRGSLKEVTRRLAPDLDAIVAQCLAKSPAGRYSSVEALATDLQCWLDGKPVSAKPGTTLQRASKFVRRHRLAVGATTIATVAMVVLTTIAVVLGFRAHDESSRARAARDFLIEMFRVADPDHANGLEPSARHILETASDRAVLDLKEQPDLLAAVLDIVAQMQGNLGLFTVADTTLERLVQALVRQGKRRDLAMAQTARALNAYQLGDEGKADVLIAEAAESARPFAGDHELQARLVLTQGWIARGAGRYPQAREAMAIAMAQATLAFGPNHIHTVEAIRGLAEVEAELGHHDAALRLLADATTRANLDPSADARYRHEVAIARANALLRAGQFKEATELAAALLPACERLSGPQNIDCSFLRRLWAVALLRSDAPAAALRLADALSTAAADSSSPILQAVSTMTLARVLAENGRLSSRPDVSGRLVDLSTAGSIPLTYRVQSLLVLAEADVLSGSYSRAEQRGRQAMQLLDAGGSAPVRGRGKVTLALALRGEGRDAEALLLLDQAESDLDVELGSAHPLRALYSINRAVSLHHAHRDTEALSILDARLPTLRIAFGEGSPTVRRVVALREAWATGRTRSPAESARIADVFL